MTTTAETTARHTTATLTITTETGYTYTEEIGVKYEPVRGRDLRWVAYTKTYGAKGGLLGSRVLGRSADRETAAGWANAVWTAGRRHGWAPVA